MGEGEGEVEWDEGLEGFFEGGGGGPGFVVRDEDGGEEGGDEEEQLWEGGDIAAPAGGFDLFGSEESGDAEKVEDLYCVSCVEDESGVFPISIVFACFGVVEDAEEASVDSFFSEEECVFDFELVGNGAAAVDFEVELSEAADIANDVLMGENNFVWRAVERADGEVIADVLVGFF